MELKITAQREGRLSSFLKEELKMSTGLINKLKWGDAIRVNSTPQRTNFPVSVGDSITVQLKEEAPEYPPEEGPLDILYEDEYILAVDKAPGILIHPSRSKNQGTLANYVFHYYQKTGQHCAFHPLTRLDRDTFGIVLLAKNSHIHALLQAADVSKTYHALTFGGPDRDEGTIDAPIARNPLPSLLRYVGPEGKPSRTEYQVLERSGKVCRLALRPITGRTHQLRVHCAYMGWPILGDPQYGSEASQQYSAALNLCHQQLCAKRLEFLHPVTGESLSLESHYNL